MKAHRTDIVSFAFGLAFLGLSAWWLLARILGLALPPVGWFLAGALILIGLLGLVGALRSGRNPEPEPAEATVSAPYETGTPAGEAGAPAAEEADEWVTDGVTDAPLAAREDRPYDAEPHWSPEVTGEPATRELPVVDEVADRPGGGPRTGGDGPG
ncbi:hypothetical protein F8274_29855 [Micromonospora sp. AMSO31t]|nr:hypothetical protein [Micromonospora sp. AMSO31t]KAB1902754.1 hypothetical protein F8274_29855 [Micromonospora sp. AMSO31t]